MVCLTRIRFEPYFLGAGMRVRNARFLVLEMKIPLCFNWKLDSLYKL